MFHAGIPQALAVWTHLESALRGEHNYGSDVAEIYVYLLEPRSPMAEHQARGSGDGVALRAAARGANEDFYELLVLFEEMRDAKVEIQMAGNVRDPTFKKLGPWLREHGEYHRWHVRVTPKEDRLLGSENDD
ncbi:MAG TPA: hypothetical protein VFA98_11260 [Thermoanaerobaculia bacterium]|nr:hypothetical protein [Thermoanaerobaculia bacterium]